MIKFLVAVTLSTFLFSSCSDDDECSKNTHGNSEGESFSSCSDDFLNSCPKGASKNSEGGCDCPIGQYYDGSNCTIECPEGQHYDGEKCASI